MTNTLSERRARLESYLASDPGNRALMEDLLNLYQQQGDHAAALPLLRRLLDAASPSARLLNIAAGSFIATQRWGEAKHVLNRACQLEPGIAAIWTNLGHVYLATEELPLALHHFSRAMELEPTNVEAHYNVALIHNKMGNVQKARSCLERALWLDSDFAPSHFLMASLEIESGNYAAANSHLDVLRAHHNYAVDAVLLKAQIAMMSLDFENALRTLRDYLQGNIATAPLKLLIAQNLLALQRPTQALKEFEAAIRMDRTQYDAYVGAGWAQIQLADAAGARSRFSQAIALNSSRSAGYSGLAYDALLRGSIQEANTFAEKALALDADDVVAALVRDSAKGQSGTKEQLQTAASSFFGSKLALPMGGTVGSLAEKYLASASGKKVVAKHVRHQRQKVRATASKDREL